MRGRHLGVLQRAGRFASCVPALVAASLRGPQVRTVPYQKSHGPGGLSGTVVPFRNPGCRSLRVEYP